MSKKTIKRLFIILLLIVTLSGVFFYFYMYKSQRDIAFEKPDFSVTVVELQNEFVESSELSNQKYLDKTIEVNGKITNIDTKTHSIVLDHKLFAVFKDSVLNNLILNKETKIKGRFIGYDDLLEEFKIDQVSLSN